MIWNPRFEILINKEIIRMNFTIFIRVLRGVPWIYSLLYTCLKNLLHFAHKQHDSLLKQILPTLPKQPWTVRLYLCCVFLCVQHMNLNCIFNWQNYSNFDPLILLLQIDFNGNYLLVKNKGYIEEIDRSTCEGSNECHIYFINHLSFQNEIK